ncbi:MAG: protein kinase [Planctomycetaceae bacterium]|nr:protein kinase [Planctomycetaceae bacterium]
MADKDKPEPDDIDKDAAESQNADDGDLGFANDTWDAVPSSGQPPIPGLDRDFIPQNVPERASADDGTPPADSEEPSASDTWVPDVSGTADASSRVTDDDAPSLDADKTWVPSSTPTASGIDRPAERLPEHSGRVEAEDADPADETDVNKTVMPSSTPTVDGTELADDSDPYAVDKTWVPPADGGAMAQTHSEDGGVSRNDDGAGDAGDEDDPLAVDKTWVVSGAPTINASDLPSAAQETVSAGERGDDGSDGETDGDTSKTWVPSSTPTRHVMGPAEDGDDPNKTWVPSDTPTADGMGGDVDPSEMGTVVAGPPPDAKLDAGDSAVMETVEAPLLGNEQTVYSQTMGMRSPGNDEFDDWQNDQDALSEGDTAVLDVPEESGTSNSRKTQIWSQQSGDGLSSALTIRHAPVAGESLFDNTLNSDKPDYQIIKKLAEGGMGAVYVARQTSLGRELAIKTLKPLRDRDRKTYTAQGRISQVEHQRREMFLSEALVTGNLVHPHIIPIHDLCQTDDGSPFYSMKRVHGTPWNERIQEMTLDENLEVLMKVCDAMAYAHHNGVVNRDLKPENVMLGEFGEVLVLDWGLAVPASAKDKGRFPSPAAPFGAGTPAYMSPELWTGPENHIGVWSDVYLLGATLFEAITGVPPHEFPEPDSSAGNTGLWMTIDKVVRRNSIRETEHSGELMDIACKAMETSPKKTLSHGAAVPGGHQGLAAA